MILLRTDHKRVANVIYLISFDPNVVKIGKTTMWRGRRFAYCNAVGREPTNEAPFLVDQEAILEDLEDVAIDVLSSHYQRSHGREWFRAPFEEALLIVRDRLLALDVVIDFKAATEQTLKDVQMSGMTANQFDRALQEFAVDHGVPVLRIVRWLGADRYASVITVSGYVPDEVRRQMAVLWKNPALLRASSEAMRLEMEVGS